jgi:mono/diheme cytochrome c family protein
MPGGPKIAEPDRLAREQARSIEQYRKHCINCHEADGRGESSRELMRKIPDFTRPEWHATRDADYILRTIREGKGSMPAMKDRLGPGDAVLLMTLLRNFRGGGQVIPDGSEEPEGPAKPSGIQRVAEPTGPDAPSVRAVRRPASGPAAPRSDASRAIFRQFCVRCHGADGHGDAMRALVPRLPDFASPDWHSKRSDSQLVASILEGKGTAMPAFGGKLGETQAREVLTFIRSFAFAGSPPMPKPPDDFRRRFERLRDEMEQLDRQYRSLSSQ